MWVGGDNRAQSQSSSLELPKSTSKNSFSGTNKNGFPTCFPSQATTAPHIMNDKPAALPHIVMEMESTSQEAPAALAIHADSLINTILLKLLLKFQKFRFW